MRTKNFFLTLLLAAMISVPVHLGAQITIGSGNPPSEWSLLDLDNRGQDQPRALHLPRLTITERNALFNPENPNPPAAGLMIFRTDAIRISDDEYLGCLEFWNGVTWISLCEGNEPPVRCGAYIAPGIWREFMCHNLGADTSLDPFTPHAGLHGAMFKWGTGIVAMTAQEVLTLSTQAQVDATGYTWAMRGGGTPPDGTDNWNMATANPCPPGFRIPTEAEWRGVINNNTPRRVGTWTADNNPYPQGNFSSGTHFGDALFLPATGFRTFAFNHTTPDGAQSARGSHGYHWSTTASGTLAFGLWFHGTAQGLQPHSRDHGYPVRCIAE